MKKRILIVFAGVAIVSAVFWFLNFYPKALPVLTDAQKFAQAYTQVWEENLFVYKTPEEALQILKKGTGILFFGFSSCQRCQQYAPYLNEVAQQEGIEKIFYIDIKQARAENTETYQQIVALLGEYLLADDEGNPRIYVPDVTIVSDGKVLFHDNESSVVTEADWTPEEYWTTERVVALKHRLAGWMRLIPRLCSDGCNE